MVRIAILAILSSFCFVSAVQAQQGSVPVLPGELHPSPLLRYPIIVQIVVEHDDSGIFGAFKGEPSSRGGGSDPGEIWYSERTDTGWTAAESLSYPVNTNYSDVLFSLSPDNNVGLIYGVFVRDIQQQRPGFSLMFRKTADFWDSIQPLHIQGYYNNSQHYFAQLAADGYTLLLALERDDTQGDLDLYVSQFDLERGYFSTPVSLGSTVNSSAFEGTPWLAPDLRTLYFSSTRDGGLGGEDVYVTRRKGELWDEWTTPELLPASVNTKHADMNFHVLNDGTGLVKRRVPKAFYGNLWMIDSSEFPSAQPARYMSGNVSTTSNEPGLMHIRSWKVDANGKPIPCAQTWTYINQRDWKVLTPEGTMAVTIESEAYQTAMLSLRDTGVEVNMDSTYSNIALSSLSLVQPHREQSFKQIQGFATLFKSLNGKVEGHIEVALPRGLNDRDLMTLRREVDALVGRLAQNGVSVFSSFKVHNDTETPKISIRMSAL